MLEEELPDSCALDDVDDTEDCELEALVELSWLDDDPPVGAELDEDLEVFQALLQGEVGGQRLAGGALAQHAVAARAALEEDALGLLELGF